MFSHHAPFCSRDEEREQRIYKSRFATTVLTYEQRSPAAGVQNVDVLVEGSPISDLQSVEAKSRRHAQTTGCRWHWHGIQVAHEAPLEFR